MRGMSITGAGVMTWMGLGSLDNLDKLVLWNMDGLPVAFPIIAFAFSSQTILFDIAASLKSPSVSKMGRVVDKSMCDFLIMSSPLLPSLADLL